ncbi:hypothetical protein Tco_0248591, partial [Tanacetum coccineum]
FNSSLKDVDNDKPKSVVDDPKQVEDNDEYDDKDKSKNDSSLNEDNTAGQQLNTASPEVNTGSPKVNTFFSDEDELEVELGNIPNSYAVPTTPHIRIHKDYW